jgi:GT2 family glycosyltransferase
MTAQLQATPESVFIQPDPSRISGAPGGNQLSSQFIPGLVSIVIPNWNGKRFLAGCLDSMSGQRYAQFEIIVVDNGSHDGSVELLQEKYNEVRLVRFEVNTGFSVAVNAGIRAASGEFIALLNNDTIVENDWLAEMVRVMREHDEIGSTGCKMLAYDDKTLLDGAGDGYRRGGLPGRIGHRERDLGQFDQQRYILGACGGAALYRRSMLLDIGLFDEDYFAYLEDVDLGLRAQNAGYKCIYVPTAVIYHLGCGTTGSGYHPLVVRLSSQNNLNTLIKNVPAELFFRFLPHMLYWQLYYFAVVIVRGGQVVPWLHGTWKALRLLPKMLRKRRQIEQQRRVPVEYIEEIIIRSEQDLAASRQRLIEQSGN